MDGNLDRRKRRKRVVLTIADVILLAGAGLGIYVFEQATCVWACGSIGGPVIQSAQANTTLAQGNCQFPSTSDISRATVCSVYVDGGNSGTITLTVANHGNEGEGSDVDFWVYSSLPDYINFTAIPTCAYTSSTPPLNGPASCNIESNSPQSFQFTFTVSESYGSSSLRELASVTVMMYQTCCFP